MATAASRPQPHCVAVAASGGRDSTALLHATVRQAQPLGIEVVALHVHHGLMPEADVWLEHVRRQARRFGARFACERLSGQPAPGDSVEAWARKHRYAALAQLARGEGACLVLLAQHRRDQAETFLIQALRGGGAPGLAGMPRLVERDGITWARPWLGCSRASIEAYVRRCTLSFIEDPSNDDPRFARGRLRALWPALEEQFVDAETTLARAAQRAAIDAAVLDEIVEADLAALGAAGQPLPVAAWLRLSLARRSAVLRRWLATVLPTPVPETLVRRLADELPGRLHARWPAGEGDLVLARGLLAYGAAAPGRRHG
ncbi:MAG: tRNA lysidine(34) synthetase TilS [Betaproteobacteria bacterium]|nr:tRNA lysidine(34) synthetase TilS [Betaproteobacteria bacterium]